MTERYPDDATLLAMEQDPATGVEFIPTGKSPYYLEFRKLIQRLLLAAQRANDLRVYPDGELTVGVRPGRCAIGQTVIDFAGAEGIALANNATTRLWLAADGSVQSDADAMPDDPTTFVPLAEVTTESGAISAIVDRRGEAMLGIVDLPTLGVQATAVEINEALAGIDPGVDAAALNALTAGGDSVVDALHRHDRLAADLDAEHHLTLANAHPGDSAGVALRFELSGVLPGASDLVVDRATGWLRQRALGQELPLLGNVQTPFARPGPLNASQTGLLVGPAPMTGTVAAVLLSVADNIQSDQSTDQLSATVRVNGAAVTDTDPALASSDGAGFRCTGQGDGVAAAVKTDGTEHVAAGDLLTVDLNREAAGNVATEATDIAVLIVIKPDQPV